MEEQLIAVVDGARARFFTVGARVTPTGEQKPTLVEVETLVNPGHRIKDGDLYSETRPGLRSGSPGGGGHAVDDRRNAHHDDIDRKFAKLVLGKMSELIAERDIRFAILAAGPQMLGHLREYRDVLPRIEVGELPKHLTELSPHDLCLRLEADGLL